MHGRNRLPWLLKEIRARGNLSQQAIATLADVTRSQVSRWENGQHQPDYIKIRRLAARLHERYPELDDLSGELVQAAGYDVPDVAAPSPPTPEERDLAEKILEVVRQHRQAQPGNTEAH